MPGQNWLTPGGFRVREGKGVGNALSDKDKTLSLKMSVSHIDRLLPMTVFNQNSILINFFAENLFLALNK